MQKRKDGIKETEETVMCNEKSDPTVKLPRLRLPVIVEGRYDKAAICSIFDATVITTDGFGVFNNAQRRALIRRISSGGVILLTDSDGGGKQIRSFVSGIIPSDKIYQLYIPRIAGKESRKRHGGKEGVLGVEGVGRDVIYPLLSPFAASEDLPERKKISTAQLLSLGLTGEGSQVRRDFVCKRLSLPDGMSAKAFAAAVQIITDEEELCRILSECED